MTDKPEMRIVDNIGDEGLVKLCGISRAWRHALLHGPLKSVWPAALNRSDLIPCMRYAPVDEAMFPTIVANARFLRSKPAVTVLGSHAQHLATRQFAAFLESLGLRLLRLDASPPSTVGMAVLVVASLAELRGLIERKALPKRLAVFLVRQRPSASSAENAVDVRAAAQCTGVRSQQTQPQPPPPAATATAATDGGEEQHERGREVQVLTLLESNNHCLLALGNGTVTTGKDAVELWARAVVASKYCPGIAALSAVPDQFSTLRDARPWLGERLHRFRRVDAAATRLGEERQDMTDKSANDEDAVTKDSGYEEKGDRASSTTPLPRNLLGALGHLRYMARTVFSLLAAFVAILSMYLIGPLTSLPFTSPSSPPSSSSSESPSVAE